MSITLDHPSRAQPPLWRVFLVFLAPMLVSNVLQSFSGTINSIYLGRMIGVNAFAATTAFFPVLFFFIAFVVGFASGATVLIGQAHGAKDIEKVKSVAGTTLAVSIMAGLFIALVGGFFAEPLLKAVGTPANILPDAVAYGRVMLIASPFLFMFLLETTIMRGVGDTITPLLAFAISIVSGAIVTPALILGWGGLPKLGVTSAAFGGVTSWILTLIFLSIYLRRRNHPLAPDAALFRHFWIDWKILKAVMRIGIPTALQMVLISIAGIAVLSFVNKFGSNVTAAYGAANQIANYIQFPAVSISVTGTIFAAHAIGSGKTERLGAITRMAMYYNLVLTGGLVTMGYILSRAMIGIFVSELAVTEIAQRMLHITLWSYVLMGASSVLAGIMRASGTVLIPIVISIVALVGVEVLAAYILSGRLGSDGIWISFPVAFVALVTMQASYYHLVWRKKPVQRLI